MCLILFAQNQHPDYKLVLAANRDEFFERPTMTAHQWNDESGIIAGKDLQAGGTWMGVNGSGRMAAVTNYRDLTVQRQAKLSRGAIVTGLLEAEQPADRLNELSSSEDHDGFNLLYWDGGSMTHFSNISKEITVVRDGVHGLSNHLLNTPWAKVERGKAKLASVLEHAENEIVDGLFDLLKDNQESPSYGLPETGLPADLEQKVSAMFIRTGNYGTRCSSVLLVGRDGSLRFEERSFVPEANAVFKLQYP